MCACVYAKKKKQQKTTTTKTPLSVPLCPHLIFDKAIKAIPRGKNSLTNKCCESWILWFRPVILVFKK